MNAINRCLQSVMILNCFHFHASLKRKFSIFICWRGIDRLDFFLIWLKKARARKQNGGCIIGNYWHLYNKLIHKFIYIKILSHFAPKKCSQDWMKTIIITWYLVIFHWSWTILLIQVLLSCQYICQTSQYILVLAWLTESINRFNCWWFMVHNATFNNISVISDRQFHGWRKPECPEKTLTCRNSLTNFIT